MKIKRMLPDWVIGAVVTFAFLIITNTGAFDFTKIIEMKTFDLMMKISAPEERNPDIELISITADDLAEFGSVPWSRSILAKAIQNIASTGAKVIALNLLLTEPEESLGLKTVKRLKKDFKAAGLDQTEPGYQCYYKMIEAIDDLDNDRSLHQAMKEAGNVILPVSFDTSRHGRDQKVDPFISKQAFKNIKGLDQDSGAGSLMRFSTLKSVLPTFAEVAAGIGHHNLFPDQDGYIRGQAHVIEYLKHIYFPSFALAIVRKYKELNDNVTLVLEEGFDLKPIPAMAIRIPVAGPRMMTMINWNQGPNIVFHQTPFSTIIKNKIHSSLFKDKIVILGPTVSGIGGQFLTPVSGQLSGIEVVANSVANILNQRFISRPPWVPIMELASLIFFGLFLTIVLPRMRAWFGAFITLGLLGCYCTFGISIFTSSHIWIKIAPSIIMLSIGYVLIIFKHFIMIANIREKREPDFLEMNKMLGISFQQQGMLDLALDKFQNLPLTDDNTKELLYKLGLDYEKKRQFSKALSIYKLIIKDCKAFRDLDQRISRLKDPEGTMIFGSTDGKYPADIASSLMAPKPTLGRYELLGKLGQGSMGVVYKGRDPKMNRTVAIKAINLSEFDEDTVDELKDRFFREAESAGLLAHPNIVTIYDCGEENDLAFIAMEHINGEELEGHTKKGHLLPMRETLNIMAHVAEALDYAHANKIVHRDIKPANIMRRNDDHAIKVTDFGIARITSESKTQTGIVMGTPSYMSPEQVAGKKVDGRSDIFSMGVVLYEMLTGQKPFRGEDITSLMFKIAKEKHPSVRTLNPKIPFIVEKIIDKALEKELNKRYLKAGQMAEHLKKVVAKIDHINAKKSISKPNPA